MIEELKKYGNKVAAFDNSKKISYASLCDSIYRAMKTINKSEVAICMQHGIIYMIYMFAAIENGATVYLLSPNAKNDSLEYIKSKSIDLYVDSVTYDSISKYYPTENIILVDKDVFSKTAKLPQSYISDDARANIVLSTSGTTSTTTKFVCIPFNNMVLKSRMISTHLGIKEDDVTYFMSPLCFVQTIWTALIHLINGASLYFDNFNPYTFDKILSCCGITTLITVPSVIRGIIDKNTSSYNLRLLSIGGDYMDERLLGKLKEKWPKVSYANVYGATETCAADTIFDPIPFEHMDDTFLTLGRETEYSRVFIISDKGELLGNNTEGNICIQSPFLIDHYYNLDLRIRNEKGYFITYDKGYVDDKGRLHYSGRSNSIINYNGKKISACEIENEIYKFGGISDVVVIGKPHDIYGQVPIAYVVSETPITEQNLRFFLMENVEKHKVPRKIVFVNNLIKTNSGKTIRNATAYEE